MKICPHCHHENPDSAYYCFKCGQVVESLEQKQPEVREPLLRYPLPGQRQEEPSDDETIPLSATVRPQPAQPQPQPGPSHSEPDTDPSYSEPDTGPSYSELDTDPVFNSPGPAPLAKARSTKFDTVSSVLICVWFGLQLLIFVLQQALPMLLSFKYERGNDGLLAQTALAVVSNLLLLLPAVAVKKLPLRIVSLVLAVLLAGMVIFRVVLNYLGAPAPYEYSW